MNINGNCYVCDTAIKHAYQVKIIHENGNMEFVKCCCLEHAENLKEENVSVHKKRYEDIENQCVQRLS
jgi:hypothetical protein